MRVRDAVYMVVVVGADILGQENVKAAQDGEGGERERKQETRDGNKKFEDILNQKSSLYWICIYTNLHTPSRCLRSSLAPYPPS